jgi:multidrug efflux system membrane fusion protein
MGTMRILLPRLLALGLLLAAAPAFAQPRGPAVPVEVAVAQRGPVPVGFPANGVAASEAVVSVRTRVDGQIERVHVVEGQMVHRGDLLFTLDRRLLEATAAQQEAQLARDRATAVRTQADAARYASLRGEGFTAQQRFEQAQADAAVAAANVRASEALLAYTRTLIGYATIVAEVDGRLGQLPLREGNLVRASENTMMATITPMDPLVVRFAAPERWVPQIRAALASGQPPMVLAGIPNDPGPPAEGRLVFMDSQVDQATGTIALTARFPNGAQRLWPGQWLNLQVALREEEGVTVPVQAVQQGPRGAQLFVVEEGGTAKRRQVRVERVVDGRAVVSGELREGERVVVEGANLLTDGARVAERQPQQPRQGARS